MTRWLIIPVICFICAVALAEPKATEPSTRESEADKISLTHHEVTIGGATIQYDARAGTIALKDDDGKTKANFFFVSYTKEPEGAANERPITFVFNGGPGAAAVWLHLGTAGPKRVALDANGIPGAPPHGLIDNDQSWLDVTDLVFIDPVGTGYSRPAEGQKASDFFGVEKDIDSVGDFIRLYLTRYQRWDSPKFLAGESYGTTRAAGLSEHLLDAYGIDLNGIILISTVLNFQSLDPTDGNDLPYALYLPSYTSVALYHHKIQTTNEDALLQEVENYASHDYLNALAQGGALSADARADVVAHLARYTGLPPDLIDKANLRIGPDMFRKKLLNDERLIIGRYDARITGQDPNPATNNPEYDPSYTLYLPVYEAGFNDYVRKDLKFESDLDYEVLSGKVEPWDFGIGPNGMGYLNVSGDLRRAMLANPHLKVLVCSGYDDLATPFFATRYTFDHLDLTDRLQANVTQTFYHSGHMIYHNPDELRALKQNIAAFIASATGKKD